MLEADMDLAPSPSPSSSSTNNCNDRDNIDSVEALVVLAIAAMFFLHLFGSLRRRSSHGLIQAMVTGVTTLSYPLVSYTIGRINSSDWYIIDFPLWAVFMLLLLGSTDNLTVCRLNDIDNWKTIYVKHLFKGFLVVYIVLEITLLQKQWRKHRYPYLYPLLAVLLVGLLKWYQRIASMRMVSKSYLRKNMKVIAEYMKLKESNLPTRHFDPETMEGCNYMVAGEKHCTKQRRPEDSSSKVTTVEQIWQCPGNLLLGDRGRLLKDVCLSMALAKMLNLRIAGFKLSEANLEEARDLVFRGLLHAGKKPYLRAFRVIEEELVFVHDLYYTRYSYLYQKGRYLAPCLPIAMIGICSWLTSLVVRDRSKDNKILTDLTIFITVVLAFLELYQLYLYVASGWLKVAVISSYVSSPLLQSGCFQEMILGLLLRLEAFRPWMNKLGQYCIIQEVCHKSRVRNCLHYATLRLVDRAKNTKGRKKSVRLSENVKKAIVDSLLGSNGNLTSGVTSLKQNGVYYHLSWACDATAAEGWEVTRIILVWHIATTLCEHQLDAQAKKEDVVTTASTLSQYCLHLLAFAPHLLPDHISVSESILEETIEKAGELLQGVKTMVDRCAKLMNLSGSYGDDEASRVIADGARLANHLLQDIQEMRPRWKVLSDFWAEMMLYVSPSDDARVHLETLARGGEFITHLWALLTHAGELKRAPIEPNHVV